MACVENWLMTWRKLKGMGPESIPYQELDKLYKNA